MATILAWLGGAALLAWLLVRQDWQAFAPILLASGWGVAWLGAFHILPLLLDTLAWRALLPVRQRPDLASLLVMRWHGESVNSLLPAAQVGGELLRARLAALAGVPGPLAAASVVVDLTLSVLTLLVFVAGGVLFIALATGKSAVGGIAAGAGLALGIAGLAGFWLLQRSAWPARAIRAIGARGNGSFWQGVARDADAFSATLAGLYRARPSLWSSSLLQLAAWCAGAGEVWLGLLFLGHPVSFAEALLLESLVQGIRNAAFMIPGALGVQDGGLMLIGPLVGVPPDTALALSLLKRAREVVLGAPGLLHWYWRSARGRAL